MHSDLPIVTPDPSPPPPTARRSLRDRYGGLFYLGTGGLIVVVALVSWFGVELYRMRGVWQAVYVLHDSARPEPERILAAYDLTRQPRVSARQLWDIALRTDLPPLARYLVAEAVPPDAATADPRGYALAVARSPGWPDWLRLLLARPMLYAAIGGTPFPVEALAEARQATTDPILALWLLAIEGRVVWESHRVYSPAMAQLDAAARTPGPQQEMAGALLHVAMATLPDAVGPLDRITRELRVVHPSARAIWQGWDERNGQLLRTSAPILPRSDSTEAGTRVPAQPAGAHPSRSPSDAHVASAPSSPLDPRALPRE